MGLDIATKPIFYPDAKLSNLGKYSKIGLCVNAHEGASDQEAGGQVRN